MPYESGGDKRTVKGMAFRDRPLVRTGASSADASKKPSGDYWIGPPAAYDVSATWLQLPALRSAGWLVNVVGESFNQDALEVVGGGRTTAGAAVPLVTAQLIREPGNPYDANAVRVDIAGFAVGHLARGEAPAYHPLIEALTDIGRPATCRAWITGGWDRRGDMGRFGVRLDVHRNLDITERGAILPFGDRRIAITGEENAQDHLTRLLGVADRQEVIAVLGQPAERIGVWVHGILVGALTSEMSERYGPWVAEVQDLLLPASCEARLVRGPKMVEVFLKLVKPWGPRLAGTATN